MNDPPAVSGFPDPGATPELDRLAAVLFRHRQRRGGGRLGEWSQLNGIVRQAMRNEVVAVLDAMTAQSLATVREERRGRVQA